MLSKDQSEKWKYLKYLFIGPVTGVLFLLFSLNRSEPVVQTIDRAETALAKAINQPLIVNPALSKDGVENYQLNWGDLECACYNDQYPGLYYCEDKSLSPENLRRLIRDYGGFRLSRDGAPQHILELTAVSKNMKDMGGFQGQFDEMGTDFRKDSPLWEQAEEGDVFRFTFKNGVEDHFEFEVVISDASKNYSFGEKLVIGREAYDLINFKTHFEHSKRGGLVEMNIDEFKQLKYEPLRMQKDDRSYYTINRLSLFNDGAMRSDTRREINHTSVDLSRMRSILDARPGDEIRVRMSTAGDESVNFFIRIKENPTSRSEARKVQIQWGNMILENNQSIVISKEEVYRQLNEELYLLYKGKHKVKRETEMNGFYFTSDKQINPVKYQDLFREIIKRAKPGEELILGGMVTEGDYVLPGFRIHIDFNWRDIFAGHPNASFSKDGNSVSITNAKPVDLVRVLAQENFSPVPYVIEVDGVEYITDDRRNSSLTELLEHQLPRKSLKISRRFPVGNN